MIIPENKQEIPLPEEPDTEHPPAYSPPSQSTSSLTSLTTGPPDIKPTNFLYVTRTHSSIKATYAIDPTLRIPEAILPPLEEGETRKNVKLGSAHSSIGADLWIVGSASRNASQPVKRTTIEVVSQNGSCSVNVHNSSPYPISLVCKTHAGSVKLFLPKTFRGPITASSNFGSVTFSKQVLKHLIVFSEVNNKRFGFLGDYEESGWSADPDAWVGDEVHAETSHGSVKISFVDEEPEVDSRGPTWFNKWCGWAGKEATTPVSASSEGPPVPDKN
ncbi:hypothetical protein JAAARDRAFT_33290 [Jaapia argillacea MUCL 33604]|uniref:DUF7330 domain-containing protein n=1 Tax=Jaapia argillacea MUCL 33604 TaxID=933084 RepID=A0A067Q0P8_9AGAM|nr:hypothetical protein JAAARDRAFT_33290 [Jaapia argillacea MUCL 33604]